MMVQNARSEAFFYYFRTEDQVPENRLPRIMDKYISFDFVRERLKDSYSAVGRPSIDPEFLPRILLIGFCMASALNASWWKSFTCFSPGAGSRGWASIRRSAPLDVLEEPARKV